MTLKEKIAARLKAKAAGVNLSKTRIDAIVARAERGLTDESDDAAIDANLDVINELTPFKDIAAFDDHQRAKEARDKAEKDKADKEAAEKAAKEGKVELPADAPEWMKTFMEAQAAQTKALTDQIAALGQEKVSNTRREQFIKSMEGTSEAYQAKELKRFDRITFKDDADFASFLEDTKEDHAAAAQEAANGSLGGDKPTGGAGGSNAGAKKEATAAEVDAVVDAII